MSHEGRRAWINLETGNINTAGTTAAQKYTLLKSEGWEALKPSRKSGDTITVGEYIKEVESLRLKKQVTVNGYAKKLRQIAAEVHGIDDKNRKSVKAPEWIKKVDKVKISSLTHDKIEAWRKRKLKSRLKDLERLDDEDRAASRAHNTVNAILRNAKGLFCKETLKHVGVEFSSVPFEGISIGNPVITPFEPEADYDELLKAAAKELDEDLHLIFLLAACCGLRRSEIDRLRRQDVDLEKCTIEIVSTEDGTVKTNNSVRTLNLSKDGAPYNALKNYRLGFHCVCPENKRPTRKAERYRCEHQFAELSTWLRGKGIKKAIQPLHYLRKAFGDRIASKHGIDIAAISLGDSIEIAHKVYNSHNKTKTV